MITSSDALHGYEYLPETDEYDDARRMFHRVRTPEGKIIDCDFTPYQCMMQHDLDAWVELGFPGRGNRVGPLNSEALQTMLASFRETGIRPPCGLREPPVVVYDPVTRKVTLRQNVAKAA